MTRSQLLNCVADDPAGYRFSGRRELLGLCKPHVVDRQLALIGFNSVGGGRATADYLVWMRSVAEERWSRSGVGALPWWENAKHVDEIADPRSHPEATFYDGRVLAESRAELELAEFASRFENSSNRTIDDLASRNRSRDLIDGRIEFVTLALPRYGFRGCDVADLLAKHSNSVSLWLREGLRRERAVPEFKKRLDRLDTAISISS